MKTLAATEALDRYFLEARCKLLDVAAILDRIDRGGKLSDPRLEKIRQALQVLGEPAANRAERIQQTSRWPMIPAGHDREEQDRHEARDQVGQPTLPMAYDRKTFKERVTEKVDGALEEFYTARLAELNGQKKWVEHWLREVDRLLNLELRRVLRRPIKGKWDRRKAVEEVVEELRAVDRVYRRSVESDVKQYYGLRKIGKALPPEVTDEFYALVEESVNRTLVLHEPEA